MSIPDQHELWIGGREQAPSSGDYFDDLNPQDDSLIARIASGTVADMDNAIRNAQEAFLRHRRCLAREREIWFMRAADLVARDRQDYLDILIDEVGSPVVKAQFEVDYCIAALRAIAAVPRRIRGEVFPPDAPGVFSLSVREPLGVVAAISPFNVPLLKVTKQAGMPIACGNACVHLPSEFSAQVSLRFSRSLQEAGVPDGMFNVVTGDPFEIGDTLTTHALVKSISFCGSPVIGRHVAELAARDFKPVTLELGGKSPLIVLEDADLDAAVQAAVMGVFFFQGQACMASSRIYLQRSIAGEFTDRYVAAARKARIGDLRRTDTTIGPIISARQRERVRRHIEDATRKGAELLTGGGWQGHCCEPTILRGVTRDMEVCTQETFGPVTSLYEFDDPDEAMARANDTEYGLSFSLFTRDIELALRLAQQADSGMVHINRPTIQDEPNPPFGGRGMSGQGREGTEVELENLTQWKWITINNP